MKMKKPLKVVAENSKTLIDGLKTNVNKITAGALLVLALTGFSSCSGKKSPEEQRITSTEQAIQVLEDDLDYAAMDKSDAVLDINDYLGELITLDAKMTAIDNNIYDMQARIKEYQKMIDENSNSQVGMIEKNIRNLEKAILEGEKEYLKLGNKMDKIVEKLGDAEQANEAYETRIDDVMSSLKQYNKHLKKFGRHSERGVSSHDHNDPEVE